MIVELIRDKSRNTNSVTCAMFIGRYDIPYVIFRKSLSHKDILWSNLQIPGDDKRFKIVINVTTYGKHKRMSINDRNTIWSCEI